MVMSLHCLFCLTNSSKPKEKRIFTDIKQRKLGHPHVFVREIMTLEVFFLLDYAHTITKYMF